MKEHLPALNDDELRKKQAERFTEGIGNLGDYAKEMKRAQKINLIVSLTSAAFFLLLVAGMFGYQMLKGGGMDGVFDEGVLTRRFSCIGENNSSVDVVRNYEDAERFVSLFGGSCSLYHITGEEE